MGAASINFGPFCFDDGRRRLQCNGAEVHLSLKAYELLKLLLLERPRAIPKAELHDRLWPGTFVSDAALATIVAELRAALGESGRRSGIVRTVHGFGYAFAANAIEDGPDAAQMAAAAKGTPSYLLLLGARQFELRQGDNIIGRGRDAQIVLNSLSVSRRHARIFVSADGATIEDMSSKNGTILQSASVSKRMLLHDGDKIEVGIFMFTFRIVTAAMSTLTKP